MPIPNDSLALVYQSEAYPKEWAGRVPKLIRMLRTVRVEDPTVRVVAVGGLKYPCLVNSDGLVFAIAPSGNLFVSRHEFEILEWQEILENE